MAEINARYAETRAAFQRHTLRLLNQQRAPLVTAILQELFPAERQRIRADEFYAEVNALLDQLVHENVDLPAERGRALCQRWMNDRWLLHRDTPDGEQVYELTAEGGEALAYVQRVGGRRIVSESRIRSIMDKAQHAALRASGDRDQRVAILNAEIDRLVAERDRLAAGAPIDVASDEQMFELFMSLMDDLENLPSDFKRVEQTVTEMRRQLLQEFRADERPKGEVLKSYLDRSDNLLQEGLGGRAFLGALEVLMNDELLATFRRDVDTILSHSFADGLIGPKDREPVEGTAALLEDGVQSVLSAQRQVSATLRAHLVRHDSLRARELTQVLKDLDRLLADKKAGAKPRTRVPIAFLPPTIDVERLRTRLYDPADNAAPPPLEDVSHLAAAGLTTADVQGQGGPDYDRIRSVLIASLKQDRHTTGAQVFNGFPDSARRPVDLLGLFHMSALTTAIERSSSLVGTDDYHTVRPDGNARTFKAPRLTYTDDDRAALIADMDGARP
ncbi:DUF3375 family protein [Mycobacterium sp. IS-3022]|uniref:DUF3375 family protein n=1 Tax=Mycobacterium sp. IS-3022 TaxID=1772277 RepID=UPI000741723E|nr:DUF3375 family protein [Mycobacterium sp. IS-3022]KUI02632.1 hypothetical protein AU188_14585 [Mycobacterium sp. IS-3022]